MALGGMCGSPWKEKWVDFVDRCGWEQEGFREEGGREKVWEDMNAIGGTWSGVMWNPSAVETHWNL